MLNHSFSLEIQKKNSEIFTEIQDFVKISLPRIQAFIDKIKHSYEWKDFIYLEDNFRLFESLRKIRNDAFVDNSFKNFLYTKFRETKTKSLANTSRRKN